MRRTWPILVGIAAVGAVAGVAIAGTPDTVDTVVLDAAVVDSNTVPPVAVVLPTTVVGAPTSVDSTPTSLAENSETTTTPPPTAAGGTTTSTVAVATTVATETTVFVDPAPPTTAIVADGGGASTIDRSLVRVVVANGDGRFNLAGRNGSRLQAAGYVNVDLTDASSVTATVLYYRPGFEDEAVVMAADLLVPNALLQPLPATPVTSSDDLGDVVVVLGPDAVR